jgi:tetratricopeptide (TPR) repeat protein
MQVYDAYIKHLHNLGRMEKGVEELKKLHQIMDAETNPFQAGILKLQSIDFLCEAGKEKEALTLVKNIEKTFATGMVPGLASVGYFNYYRRTGDFQKMQSAFNEFETIVKTIGSGEAGISVLKAILLQEEGRWEEALDTLSSSLSKVAIFDENSLELLIECAKCCRKMQNYAKGIQYLDKVLKEIPFHAKALVEMSRMHYLKDDPIKAGQYVEKALTVWQNADHGYYLRLEAEALLDKIQVKG